MKQTSPDPLKPLTKLTNCPPVRPQVVAPKQESLDKAEAELRTQMTTLHQKQAELKEVTDKLQALQDNLTTKQGEKKVGALPGFVCTDLYAVFYMCTPL